MEMGFQNNIQFAIIECFYLEDMTQIYQLKKLNLNKFAVRRFFMQRFQQ